MPNDTFTARADYSISPNIKLPKYALYAAINKALMDFSTETGMEVTDIDISAFKKETKIETYLVNVKVRL